LRRGASGCTISIEIEFDPAKDRVARKRHGLSLRSAAAFDWKTALEREDDRFDDGEVRVVALGFIGDRLHVLLFAEGSHDHAVCAVSLRRAEKHEVRFDRDHR